jgi:hypothetical protein
MGKRIENKGITYKIVYIYDHPISGNVVRIYPGDDPALLGETVMVTSYMYRDSPTKQALVTEGIGPDGLYTIDIQ